MSRGRHFAALAQTQVAPEVTSVLLLLLLQIRKTQPTSVVGNVAERKLGLSGEQQKDRRHRVTSDTVCQVCVCVCHSSLFVVIESR